MIFLDSSFLVALEVLRDQNHEEAEKLMERIIENEFEEAVVSDYVFDETVTVTFNKTKSLSNAVFVGDNLRKSAGILRVDE